LKKLVPILFNQLGIIYYFVIIHMSTQLTFTSIQQAGIISSRGSDKDSDTDSHTDQSIGTSAECSTETNYAISWEEAHEHGNTEAKGAWEKVSSQSVHSPPLTSQPAVNLNPSQLNRLKAILYNMVMINSNGDASTGQPPLPTLACRPIDFVDVLLRNLEIAEISVIEVRIYGGAASYVISEASSSFNDIDVMIHVDFNPFAQHLYLDGIKCVVLKSLREILTNVYSKWVPAQIPTASILDDTMLTRAYIAKMYRHIRSGDNLGSDESNIWSLFSFNNVRGRNIEIKFVHSLKRQYTFSIDSWQIDLSNFLPSRNKHAMQESNGQGTICYCLYPDIGVAIEDVNKKHIRVIKPETVRGGCFLRYGYLLHKGYSPPSHKGNIEQELVMLERFLTDFSNQSKQSEALEGYLQSHMGARPPADKFQYLRLLDEIVDRLNKHVGPDKLPCAAPTLTAVIKAKLRKFQTVCKVSHVVPPIGLTLNHIAPPRFRNFQNALAQPWRHPNK